MISEPENWEDELEFIGGRLVFHPVLNRCVFLPWNITLEEKVNFRGKVPRVLDKFYSHFQSIKFIGKRKLTLCV